MALDETEMTQSIDFTKQNRVKNAISGTEAAEVSKNLFGGIFLDINPEIGGMPYQKHFFDVADHLSLGFVRYPDGELPDGFAVHGADGQWRFVHNKLNNGDREITNPNSGEILDSGTIIDQSLLDDLTPALSLAYPDLLHPDLLTNSATGTPTGRTGFSKAIELAAQHGYDFALVLPVFQYLRPPVFRETLSDGSKVAFIATEHVKLDLLTHEVEQFLEKLLINKEYGGGLLPETILIELGNEDYFGWNQHYFEKDSQHDFDSYSAYVYGALTAINEFRQANPEVDFKVSMQAHGQSFVAEIERNLNDMGGLSLLSNIDVIDTSHLGLDSTVGSVHQIEEDWAILSGVRSLLALVEAAGGNASDVQVYNSAWSAKSSDVGSHGNASFGLPAAGAALSLFSGLVELGVQYSANWGIGSWAGLGTNSTGVRDGEVSYSPYAEVHRMMAESLVGTHQFSTAGMDNSRTDDVLTFAYGDDSKAVIFLAANEFTGTETLALEGFGPIGHVWAERLWVDGDADTGFLAQVSREAMVSDSNEITIEFHHPFEVVRLIVARTEPGEGAVHLWGSDEADLLKGGESGDLLQGNGGDDYISGGGGNDTIVGGAGNDTIYGNKGDDYISGGPGDDKLVGGLGFDTLSYAESNSDVFIWIDDGVVDSDEGIDEFKMFDRFVGSAHNDNFRNFSKSGIEIVAGAGDDLVIIGSGAQKNLIDLGDGDDFLISYGSETTVFGGDGNDTIHIFGLNGETSVVDGGAGNDVVYLANGSSIELRFSAQGGHDVIFGFQSARDRLVLAETYVNSLHSGEYTVSGSDTESRLDFLDDSSLTFKGLAELEIQFMIDDILQF